MNVHLYQCHRTSLTWKQTEAEVRIPWLDRGFRSELFFLCSSFSCLLSQPPTTGHSLLRVLWADLAHIALSGQALGPLWPERSSEAVSWKEEEVEKEEKELQGATLKLDEIDSITHPLPDVSLSWAGSSSVHLSCHPDMTHPPPPYHTVTLCCQTKLSSLPACSLGPLLWPLHDQCSCCFLFTQDWQTQVLHALKHAAHHKPYSGILQPAFVWDTISKTCGMGGVTMTIFLPVWIFYI